MQGNVMQCNAMQQVCNLFLLYPSKQTKETPHLPLFDKIAATNNPLSFALTMRKETLNASLSAGCSITQYPLRNLAMALPHRSLTGFTYLLLARR